jgi:peptidoglycan/xylan/chitin deacetylase (PgdA/CDA1 family)
VNRLVSKTRVNGRGLGELVRPKAGYTALLYHRLAGAGVPGQERLDVAPDTFRRHVSVLRALRFTLLDEERLLAFHERGEGLPARSVVLTIDDGFRDCVAPLLRAAKANPLLFVPTSAVGSPAAWLDDVPVASWQELASLESAGVAIGSHTRTHARLTSVDDEALHEELRAPVVDLRANLRRPSSILSYPYGAVDERVRAAAVGAGYRLAFTTEPGRNEPGGDPFLLHRVSVKAWDSGAAVAWKALTGRSLPPAWERWLLLRAAARRRLPQFGGRS